MESKPLLPFSKPGDWLPHYRCPFCRQEVSSADARVLGRCAYCGASVTFPKEGQKEEAVG